MTASPAAKLLRDNRLSAEARIVALWLLDQEGDDGWVELPYVVVEGLLCRPTPKKVTRCIRQLVGVGVLTAERWLVGVLKVRLGRGPQYAHRTKIDQEVRDRVIVRAAGLCALCGEAGSLHVDHVVPLARFGTNDETNLQALCGPCNLEKGVCS